MCWYNTELWCFLIAWKVFHRTDSCITNQSCLIWQHDMYRLWGRKILITRSQDYIFGEREREREKFKIKTYTLSCVFSSVYRFLWEFVFSLPLFTLCLKCCLFYFRIVRLVGYLNWFYWYTAFVLLHILQSKFHNWPRTGWLMYD